MPYLSNDKNPPGFNEPTSRMPQKSQPVKKPFSAVDKKDEALFHGADVSKYYIDKALKKEKIKEKWDTNPRTKLSDEDIENLKTVIENPKYGTTISPSELDLAKRQLQKIAQGKGLNAFRHEDYKKIVSARKQLGKLKELEGDK